MMNYTKLKAAMIEASFPVSEGSEFTHADSVNARHFLHFHGKSWDDFKDKAEEVADTSEEDASDLTPPVVDDENVLDTSEDTTEETSDTSEDTTGNSEEDASDPTPPVVDDKNLLGAP